MEPGVSILQHEEDAEPRRGVIRTPNLPGNRATVSHSGVIRARKDADHPFVQTPAIQLT